MVQVSVHKRTTTTCYDVRLSSDVSGTTMSATSFHVSTPREDYLHGHLRHILYNRYSRATVPAMEDSVAAGLLIPILLPFKAVLREYLDLGVPEG